jgi:hypothetical protein
MKSVRKRLEKRVACMGEMGKCMQNYGLKASTEEVKWRPRHRRKDNIKTDVK